LAEAEGVVAAQLAAASQHQIDDVYRNKKIMSVSQLMGPGLPDGLFSDQKSQFGYILEGLAMEDFGVFYIHLGYFMAI
jgi:hypothetical protein